MLSKPLKQKKVQDFVAGPVKRKLILFSGFIKRKRGVFSVWRQRKFQISQAPNQQIMMAISKIQHDQMQEIINLSFSKISQSYWCVELYACFQMAVPSGERYLIAFLSQRQANKVHNSILELYNKIETNQQIRSQVEAENTGRPLKEKKYNSENNQKTKDSFNREEQFQFERENEEHLIQFKKSSISCSQYKPESVQDSSIMFPSSLVIEKPLFEDELKYLVSEQGFKLFCNFKEGRLLVKNEEVMKSILLVTSNHSSKDIIQRFFHLDLWNNKVSKIKIINRIDKGIYLVYLEFKAANFYSQSKYAHLMVTVWDFENSVLLSMRSLEKDHFQKQGGLSPIDFNLLVRIQDGNEDERLMTIVLKFGQSQNYKFWLSFMVELKQYMLFLKSQVQFTQCLREWRKNCESIIFQ